MTPRKHFAVPTLALVTWLAVPAAASVTEVRNLDLPVAVVVSGVRLESGSYFLIWELTRSQTTVSFANDEKRLATIPGRLVKQEQRYPRTQIVCGKDLDGTCQLQEIHFAGSNQAIVFNYARSHHFPALRTSIILDMPRPMVSPDSFAPSARQHAVW